MEQLYGSVSGFKSTSIHDKTVRILVRTKKLLNYRQIYKFATESL